MKDFRGNTEKGFSNRHNNPEYSNQPNEPIGYVQTETIS